MENTSNPHSNFKSSMNHLFIPFFKIRLLIIKSTLQISKLSQNFVKEFKSCQLTNALISVPTTTTQTPLETIISPFGVVGNHPDYHTLATTIGNHHQLEPPSIQSPCKPPSQIFKSAIPAFQISHLSFSNLPMYKHEYLFL